VFDIDSVKKNVSKWSGNDDNSQTGETASATKQQPATSTTSQSRQLATIGPSIHIKGELTGEEGLIIDGQVEGTINLKDNDLIIARNGQIKANVYAKCITIEGKLRGDLNGKEKVIIRQSGDVQGNINSPRVVLEDGARFKGSIDMQGNEASQSEKKTSPVTNTPGDRKNIEANKSDKKTGDTPLKSANSHRP